MSSKINKNEVTNRKGSNGQFDKRLIGKIVNSIEKGLPRSKAVKKYGMARSTLSDWMREYGSQGYHASKRGHLSLPQKRSIVRAIEEGRMTVAQAKLAYSITWSPTITKWIRDSRRQNAELVISNKTCMDNKEQNHQPDPDPEKKALKEALEEAELKIKALNTLIDIAEENLKISIRKKAGAKPS